MQQGEIRPRRDAGQPISYVVVLSGPRYIAAGKGRVVVCKVVPGVVPDDFATMHRVRYRDENGVDTIGVAVPDLIAWIPESGLGDPVGAVTDSDALMRTVGALFR
ncbi:toxin [Nocardia sp. NPDC057668]|uniref:toxin n=1 Tax=Nocardia sp. NPDC057668 TaxID=3346202 RepID=UPI00366BBB30